MFCPEVVILCHSIKRQNEGKEKKVRKKKKKTYGQLTPTTIKELIIFKHLKKRFQCENRFRPNCNPGQQLSDFI